MRFFYFFVLCLLTLTPAFAQNETTQDPVNTEKQNKDTTDGKIRTFIDHQADAIVGSMFGGASKQLSNADSIINRFDALPSFGIYKDNYFIVGTDLFHKPNDWNSDAKFQVSIRQRLTNSTLPFKTYFFLTYTQKAFWNVFQDSFPFRDLNFNPTLGLGGALLCVIIVFLVLSCCSSSTNQMGKMETLPAVGIKFLLVPT